LGTLNTTSPTSRFISSRMIKVNQLSKLGSTYAWEISQRSSSFNSFGPRTNKS
jgi:hypothetical protein